MEKSIRASLSNGRRAARNCAAAWLGLACLAAAPPRACAVTITLDYSLDAQNENWFDASTSAGLARRGLVEAAAQFLSEIIVTDDWAPVATNATPLTFTDIAAPTINDLNGQPVFGVPEGDGAGYAYSGAIPTTNRSAVAENEYVVYVGAFAFDSGASANAKGGWFGGADRSPSGAAGQAFNSWGGRIYFNTTKTWYLDQDPGVDPTDDYGVQDPNKNPSQDVSTDNWDWSTSSDTWKGFDLRSVDSSASGKRDLYATALHELMHALGATSTPISEFVGVNGAGDFIGANLVAEYGGPVPGSGGHFEQNVQSTVWSSDGIISEAVLDPNSLSGVRKYLTDVDAALLRDLGYDVLSAFPPPGLAGDYNADGQVDAADYTVWRDNLGTDFAAADGDSSGLVDAADYELWRDNFGAAASAAGSPAPEPAAAALLIAAALTRLGRARK